MSRKAIGFKRGSFRFGLVRPGFSPVCHVLTFLDFPDFWGIFPICPFPPSQPIKEPTRNMSERVRDTIRTFLKKHGKAPGLNPPRLPSLKATEI